MGSIQTAPLMAGILPAFLLPPGYSGSFGPWVVRESAIWTDARNPAFDRVVIAVSSLAQSRVRQLVERLGVLPNEIMLLVDQSDSAVPLFDTTALHAAAAVELALS